jgi:hypothetical protein
MNSIATPYKEKESVRVELIPGSGEAIYFKLSSDKSKVDALVYGDLRFDREK